MLSYGTLSALNYMALSVFHIACMSELVGVINLKFEFMGFTVGNCENIGETLLERRNFLLS